MAAHFSLHGSIRNVPQCNQRARQVEELGYESLFTADHQLLCLDPFQALAISAGQTHRLRLGIAVTNMVYRDPTVLASSIATLNEISDGRAILGLGTGDGPVYGLGRKATPMARFEEGVKEIRISCRERPLPFPPGSSNFDPVNYQYPFICQWKVREGYKPPVEWPMG